jgi:hypothetical protein
MVIFGSQQWEVQSARSTEDRFMMPTWYLAFVDAVYKYIMGKE